MKILLIGREGQVAWELRRELTRLGDVVAVDRGSTENRLDLLDTQSIETAIIRVCPRVVVNAAAYTAVDRAEEDSDQASQINGVSLGVIAKVAKSVGAGLVHFSTDYIFDGKTTEPYCEDATTNPRSVYGKTKLQGEQAIQEIDFPYLILRTSWVYGSRGKNFLLTMLRLMREQNQLKIVDDQVGTPTWSRVIAEYTAQIIEQCSVKGRFTPGNRSGVYNLSCNGQTTWYGFAKRIATVAKQKGVLNASCAELFPVPTEEYPTPAIRPAYSVLSNEKLKAIFGLLLPDWEDALDRCLDDFD